MTRKQSYNFLIRNMPAPLYEALQHSAKEHRRSNNQEALVILNQGLTKEGYEVKRIQPFKWPKKISSKAINEAIDEGRP